MIGHPLTQVIRLFLVAALCYGQPGCDSCGERPSNGSSGTALEPQGAPQVKPGYRHLRKAHQVAIESSEMSPVALSVVDIQSLRDGSMAVQIFDGPAYRLDTQTGRFGNGWPELDRGGLAFCLRADDQALYTASGIHMVRIPLSGEPWSQLRLLHASAWNLLGTGQLVVGLPGAEVCVIDSTSWDVSFERTSIPALQSDTALGGNLEQLHPLPDGKVLAVNREFRAAIVELLPDNQLRVHRVKQLEPVPGSWSEQGWVHNQEGRWFAYNLQTKIIFYDFELNEIGRYGPYIDSDSAQRGHGLWAMALSPDGSHLFSSTSQGLVIVARLEGSPPKIAETWQVAVVDPEVDAHLGELTGREKPSRRIQALEATADGAGLVCGLRYGMIVILENRPPAEGE